MGAETTLALLRHPSYCISGYSAVSWTPSPRTFYSTKVRLGNKYSLVTLVQCSSKKQTNKRRGHLPLGLGGELTCFMPVVIDTYGPLVFVGCDWQTSWFSVCHSLAVGTWHCMNQYLGFVDNITWRKGLFCLELWRD